MSTKFDYPKVNEALAIIRTMNLEELQELDKIERVIYRDKLRDRAAMTSMAYAVGDTVEFDHKGRTWTGLINFKNTKTARVDHIEGLEPGRYYRVPWGMLRKVAT